MSITGVVAMAVIGSDALVLIGAATFGAGFGVLQNATLSLMYARVPESGFSAVSAIWNAGYDLGMAVGAAGVALLVTTVGFGPAFLITGLAMVPALWLASRETAERPDLSTSPEVALSAVPVAA